MKASVDQAVAFVQKHWQRLRVAAGTAYAEYGRGAFLFDLTTYHTAFDSKEADVTYLDVATAREASDAMARILLGAELDAYDPRRQIAFVFWHPESEEASIRVLTETPDGNPRTGIDRRWNNAPRACPECGTTFVEVGPWGQCPNCEHEFVADYDNQRTEMVSVAPIVELP